ncbi:MAG: arginine repressor [Actinomycetota bacterium]
MKSDRHRELLRILHQGHAARQQDIVAELQAKGHVVTQATVSRDLQEVGALKIRQGDQVVYRLPDEIVRAAGGETLERRLERAIDDLAIEFRVAGNLVVVLTAPSHATALARAIDLAGLSEVVGTVAGDDTIFVATPNTQSAAQLARRWSRSAQLAVGGVG